MDFVHPQYALKTTRIQRPKGDGCQFSVRQSVEDSVLFLGCGTRKGFIICSRDRFA